MPESLMLADGLGGQTKPNGAFKSGLKKGANCTTINTVEGVTDHLQPVDRGEVH
jgi:hypothetical protein